MPVNQPTSPYPLTLDSRSRYRLFEKYLLTDDELKENGFPRESLYYPGKIVIGVDSNFGRKSSKRSCARCSKSYQADSNPADCSVNPCYYHPKKVDITRWSHPCCHKAFRSPGCTKGKHHVSSECDLSDVEFTKTIPAEKYAWRVFALDCEMVYTTGGLELAKVCIVNAEGKKEFESFVKPQMEILDYNTEYSGITSDDIKRKAMPFSYVQQRILYKLPDNSIIIGHGLDNDLRALRLIHKNVVDTSVLFPHKRATCKKSLKSLAKEFLNKDIQTAASGHDCAEDARTVMELVLHKINLDLHSTYSLTTFPVAQSGKDLTNHSPAHQSTKLKSRKFTTIRIYPNVQKNPVLEARTSEPKDFYENRKLIETPPPAVPLTAPAFADPALPSFEHERLEHVHRSVDAEQVSNRHGVRGSSNMFYVQHENGINLVCASPPSNSFGYEGLSSPNCTHEYWQDLCQTDNELARRNKYILSTQAHYRRQFAAQDENNRNLMNTFPTERLSGLNSPGMSRCNLQHPVLMQNPVLYQEAYRHFTQRNLMSQRCVPIYNNDDHTAMQLRSFY